MQGWKCTNGFSGKVTSCDYEQHCMKVEAVKFFTKKRSNLNGSGLQKKSGKNHLLATMERRGVDQPLVTVVDKYLHYINTFLSIVFQGDKSRPRQRKEERPRG